MLSPDGVADAAIVVQGPTVRLTDKRIAEIVPMVRATAAEVAATLAREPLIPGRGRVGLRLPTARPRESGLRQAGPPAAAAWTRSSGMAVDSHSAPRRSVPMVQIGARATPPSPISWPSGVTSKPSPSRSRRASPLARRPVSRGPADGDAGSKLGPVQLTTAPTASAPRHAPCCKATSAPSAVGSTPRTRRGVELEPPAVEEQLDGGRRLGRHAVAHELPTPGEMADEALPLGRGEAPPEAGRDRPQPVDHASPVLASSGGDSQFGADDTKEIPGGRRGGLTWQRARRCQPGGDGAVGGGEPPVAGDGVDHALVATGVEAEGDVDGREPGTDEQHRGARGSRSSSQSVRQGSST